MMMIERVAKGMFDACMARRFIDTPEQALQWPPMRETEQEWLGHARAALTALLEPSEGMIEAADEAVDYTADGTTAIIAAIQAALDEKEGRGGKARN